MPSFSCVAGVDEAGRGALAGPVVAAAVILAPDFPITILKDSKLLSAEQREDIFVLLTGCEIGVGIVSHGMIDRINIFKATMEAMKRAVAKLKNKPGEVLIDGNKTPNIKGARAIVQGDRTVPAISAASIVAKVTRDRIMRNLAIKFPQYRFDAHKGYGTALHYDLLFQHGPCGVHRRSFNLTRQEPLFEI